MLFSLPPRANEGLSPTAVEVSVVQAKQDGRRAPCPGDAACRRLGPSVVLVRVSG